VINTKSVVLILLIPLLTACATFYEKNISFQEKIQKGDIQKAEKQLENDTKWENGKNRILYYLNRGYTNWLLEEYENSNKYFSIADNLIEDQLKNFGNELLALMINPTIKPYRAEDFEVVILNYFKALNYISLNDKNAALVEVRKINNKLNSLNDKYPANKNRYARDAFAHLFMGLIYDSDGDNNNAFIAYRNAYEVYKEDYTENFKVSAPEQLKKDLMRTAYLGGFFEELHNYENEFNTKYVHKQSKTPELIFFWLNGFGPVKDEWSINFTVLPGKNGIVTFANEDLGISIPIFTGNYGSNEKAALSDLRFLRIAFPKYVERKPEFTDASISINSDKNYPLEMAQNINEIAIKTLHDRMVREVSNSIGRLAVKKGLEAVASKQNANLGTILSIANALTEKADTRNWQSLPYSISYTRIPLEKGENKLQLKTTTASKQTSKHELNLNADKDKTYFMYFHSLESKLPQN
jgi:hypothetical protein